LPGKLDGIVKKHENDVYAIYLSIITGVYKTAGVKCRNLFKMVFLPKLKHKDL